MKCVKIYEIYVRATNEETIIPFKLYKRFPNKKALVNFYYTDLIPLYNPEDIHITEWVWGYAPTTVKFTMSGHMYTTSAKWCLKSVEWTAGKDEVKTYMGRINSELLDEELNL